MAYVDGNYTVPFLCENSIGYPINVPNNGGTREYQLSFYQLASTYVDAAIGDTSGYAPSAYLVEQGGLKKVGAGLVRFDQTYCEVPVTWAEKEQVTYTFPGLNYYTGGVNWNPYADRSPITLFAVATVVHEYIQGASPNPNTAFLVTDNGNPVDYIGVSNPNYTSVATNPASEPATYVISSEVRLFRGSIWERITKTVPKPV